MRCSSSPRTRTFASTRASAACDGGTLLSATRAIPHSPRSICGIHIPIFPIVPRPARIVENVLDPGTRLRKGSAMPHPVFASLPTTIFTLMSALAVEHNAINLGQGFPDEDGPLAVREAASRALIDGPNQYPPMKGRVELRRALAAHAKRFYNLDFDVETEVQVTSGATEALTASIMGLAAPGSEVVLIEPSYDSYRPIAAAVGATVKSVILKPPHWRLTEADLRTVIGPKTSAIVINTPLNPIGRVFDRDELEAH